MRSSIRCCISCILPCGSFDVIRIVHTSGHVEEIRASIPASDFLRAYPKHVLKRPTARSSDGGPAIVVVPPDAVLRRGKIYFLIPVAPPPQKSRVVRPEKSRSGRKRRESKAGVRHSISNAVVESAGANLVDSDQYLSEILSEKVSTQRDRRRGRVGVWRPHLESICETVSEVSSEQ